MRGNMKKIAHVLGSRRITADVLTVLRVTESLCGRFSFDIILPNDAEYREIFLGCGARVIGVEGPDETSLASVSRFARYFSANPADIVHTHVSIAARVGARLAGIKRCISTRSFRSTATNKTVRRLIAPIYNAFTTATVCLFPTFHAALAEEGVRRERLISVLPCGELFGNYVKPCGCEGREPVILCPLPFFEGFGQKTLVRAFARLSASRKARLIFLGDGPLLKECRNLASRLGVGGRVEFLRENMLTKIYNINPSLLVFTHEESWELPPALLTDVRARILASDIPENREMLSGTCRFYLRGDEYSLERAIVSALTDEANAEVEDDFPSPLALISEGYEKLYSSLLSL